MNPRRVGGPVLGRRRFLAVTGGLGVGLVAGCAAEQGLQTAAVGPGSAAVAELERARRAAGQRAVEVRLAAVTGQVDIGRRTVSTWSYGGELPGQEIRVRRGNLLRVELANDLPQPTTMHWHGLALRNDMDGVPGLTQPEIAAGAAFGYEFTVPDAGTHWFHPHAGTQLDRGLYAPLVVEDPDEPGGYDEELVVVFDDWLDHTGRDPDQVLADLLANGMGGMDMGGMAMPRSELPGGDASDVIYPFFLANGRTAEAARPHATRPGRRIRLRMINAGGDTAFRVGVPGTPMTITHTDGFPVVPTQADAVLIGMGERVDAVIEMPDTAVPLLGLAEQGRHHPGPAAARYRARPGRDAGRGRHGGPPGHPGERHPGHRGRDPGRAGTRRGARHAARRTGARIHLDDQRRDLRPDSRAAGARGTAGTTEVREHHHDVPPDAPARAHLPDEHRRRGRAAQGHRGRAAGAGGGGRLRCRQPGQWLTHCHNIYHGEAGMMTVVSYVE